MSEILIVIGASVGSFAGLLASLVAIAKWGKGVTRWLAKRGAEAVDIDTLDPRSDLAGIASTVCEIKVMLEDLRGEYKLHGEGLRVIIRDRLLYLSGKALEEGHITARMKAALDDMHRISRDLGCNGEMAAIHELVEQNVKVDKPFPGIPKGAEHDR